MTKMENIQKRTLRFALDGHELDYETLLNKSGKCTMEDRILKSTAIEVFRSLNNYNPSYLQNVLTRRR